MTFTKPVVGPKVYLSRGPSGLPETFRRCSADEALTKFLGVRTLKIAVDGFLRRVALERRPEHWGDVIVYLAELGAIDEDLVPLDVAVAFWASAAASKRCAA